MAGANKNNSLKAKKRKVQDLAKAHRIVADKKKKTFDRWQA